MVPRIDWWSGAVIWKRVDGFLYFLVQDVDTIIPKHAWQKVQTKNIGGKSKDHPEDVDCFATFKRELWEELSLELVKDEEPRVIYDRIIGSHRKVFYLINRGSLKGDRRTTTLRDGGSILSAPYWIRADEATRPKVLYGVHREVAQNAVRILGLVKH